MEKIIEEDKFSDYSYDPQQNSHPQNQLDHSSEVSKDLRTYPQNEDVFYSNLQSIQVLG